jgi:hypothetical protein
MADLKFSQLIGDLESLMYNPADIQRKIIETNDYINEGKIPLVDCSNALVLTLSSTAACVSAFINEAQTLSNKQYEISATSFEEIYPHMSDVDFIDVFALPSSAKFTLLIKKSEVANALVTNLQTGVNKITIPRNSIFYASGIPFSIQYPIDIRKLSHGALQITYDATTPSPLLDLETNLIEYETVSDNNRVEYIRFEVPTKQFDIQSYTSTVSNSGGFTTAVSFTDQFYFCRVFSQLPTGKWREITISYTDEVYDPNVVTAYIKVIDKQVITTIAPIYVANGGISGKIRIDVYETKGDVSLVMKNFQPEAFKAEFKYIDTNDATKEVAAFRKINTLSVWSTDTSLGGRSALTFEQLKTRVKENSVGVKKTPITSAEMQNTLTDDGYTIIKNVDTLTGRNFWATKELPYPYQAGIASTNFYTPASASVLTLITMLSKDVDAYGIYSHPTGMTISSSSLFKTENSQTRLVKAMEYSTLSTSALADLAKEINIGHYSYTPFHYVLDTSTDEFSVRPYFMDSPSIVTRSFVAENPTTGFQVSMGSGYTISKTESKYLISVSTASSDEYKALADSSVFCQMAFESESTGQTSYLSANQLPRAKDTDERTFVFEISTNYDIDSSDLLSLISFQSPQSASVAKSKLKQKFRITFGAYATMPSTYAFSEMDAQLGTAFLNPGAVALNQEILQINFGYKLENLWCNYRTFASGITYQTYDSDVPAVYAEDIMDKDPVTGAFFKIVNGQLTYVIAKKKGDPILDNLGNPTFLHRKGDYIIDPQTGLPVTVKEYATQRIRSIDVFTIDAAYFFANDPITTQYMSFVKDSLVNWITNDLVSLNKRALELTKIHFRPRVSKGYISARINEGTQESIEAAQYLTLEIYVTKDNYLNSDLLSKLSETSIETIEAYLASKNTYSDTELKDMLLTTYGSDALTVNLKGLAGRDTDVVLTLIDHSTRLSMAKVLTVQANNQMAVKEKITINFLVHNNSAY